MIRVLDSLSPGAGKLKDSRASQALGMAALTLSGVKGIWNRRAPVASNMAFATTAPTGTIAGSPPPCGIRASFLTRMVSISGSHEKRGSS